MTNTTMGLHGIQGLLTGKRGVVLGVANDKSIAWGCAQAAAAAGARMAFNFLGPAQEKRVRGLLADSPDALILPCDVTKDDEVDAFFAAIKSAWDGLDFVIHSVAYCEKDCLRDKFVNTSRAHFAQALDVSAYSLVSVARAAAPLMTAGGSIICMSYYGAEKVVPKYNVMGVAKAALEASARYLAEDLGPQGVRVNSLSAGPIRTLSASAIPGFKTMLESASRYAPLRRNVTQEDIARSALYLLSDLSSGVTGETLHVDSGYSVLGMFNDVTEPGSPS
jgi:enoyl-[acyl-carrier protein] reductase I